MGQILLFDIQEENAGLRLDKALASHPEIKTRNRALYLIDNEMLFVNKKAQKPSYICKVGDQVEIHLPEPKSTEIKASNIKLNIVYEDNAIIVVNKPAGLVVHPANGHEDDTLVNGLLNYTKNLSMKFGDVRPGIVHRIDKETSGLLVIARNDFAHEHLALQFKNKTTHRIYYAIVFGNLKNKTGTISSFISRHPTDRKKFASVKDINNKIISNKNNAPEVGKWAVTHYEHISSAHNLSLVKLKLETGRTHQIRVHMSELGHPIVGDSLYGADKKNSLISTQRIIFQVKELNRFLLHAAELGFKHPENEKYIEFSVQWPEEDLTLIQSWELIK